MTETPFLQRHTATACFAGAALTVAGCAAAGAAQMTGNVPDDLFRAPMSHDAFLAFAVYAALIHLVILAGVLGLRALGVTGSRAGLGVVAAGTLLLFACECATVPLVDASDTGTAATLVDSMFGVATLLVTFGMLAAGVAARRRGSWAGWRRDAPLIAGVLSLIMIPIQFTSAIWLGVAIYGLGYAVLGVAVATDPAHGMTRLAAGSAAR